MRSIDEQGYHFEEWLTPKQIAEDVQQVADRINADYRDKEPLFVVVLNGAFVFAADLIRALDKDIRCEQTFIRVSSYFGMATTGQLEFIVPLQQVVDQRDVIIVEDIVDTGVTLNYLKSMLIHRGAASIRIAALLDKTARRTVKDLKVDYVCFDIPDAFVVGYGLDYDQVYRNLPDIGVLAPRIYAE